MILLQVLIFYRSAFEISLLTKCFPPVTLVILPNSHTEIQNPVKVNVAIASHMHWIFLKYHKMDYSQKGLLHFIIKERLQDLETS